MKYKQITKEIILHGLKPAKIGGRNRPSKTMAIGVIRHKKKEKKTKNRK